ncbi:ABC transporter permease [Sphingobacterium yanglingense]|nr:ABC transporter permease [Sphingobacterium yanglingense]
MVLNGFIKIAFRNLKRTKGFTAINIIGLAVGMASAMLIILWVSFQWSFDKIYPKAALLYTVGSIEPSNEGFAVWFSTPKPLAAAVKNEIPQVRDVSRFSGVDRFLLTVGNKKIISGRGAFVDSTFLGMFDLPVLAGDPETALVNPSNIVLSKGMAISLFGSTDIIGKTIKVDSAEVVHVTAVLDDIPSNSRFSKSEYFLPWTFMEKIGFADQSWHNSSVDLFVLLHPNVNLGEVQQKLKGITKKNADLKTENFLKPIGESYLYDQYKNGIALGGRIEMVRAFIIIAIFILLIACINFMNLSTAQSERRAKEVGIRKVVGAGRKSLIGQFLSESILLSFVSGILALLIAYFVLPSFGQLVGSALILPLSNVYFWFSFVGFILLTGILAGSYPAFFMSSFQPVNVLKGKFIHIPQKLNPRKILVVIQFSIAVVLIIATLVIRQQLLHAQNREVGFDKKNLIYVSEIGDIPKNMELIKRTLLEQNIAISTSRTMSPITQRWSGWNGFIWEGKDPNSIIQFNRQATDEKIVATVGLQLIAGRDFDLVKFPTDSMSAIINETAAKVMNLENPIGNYIVDGTDKFTIIGVVKDFIQESPFRPVLPTVIEGAHMWLRTLHIKFNPQLSTQEALTKTEKIFKTYNPNYPFDYRFLDTEYAEKFNETQKTARLATLFAVLTIFISCLGLFGLAAYMAESRIKEIGIRKVLGASVFSVMAMLSKEFVILVIISCIIAFPIAYWAMDHYISSFGYRKEIGWDIFVITGVLTLMVAVLTVSFQSIKASLANPVNSLRNE